MLLAVYGHITFRYNYLQNHSLSIDGQQQPLKSKSFMSDITAPQQEPPPIPESPLSLTHP